jgi:lipopolysaccharide export system protein LptA
MKISACLLVIPALLCGETISSKKATYDGNALVLKGDVELEHGLGKLSSGNARLEKEEKDGPFSSISLREDVLISLKNLGKISCETADLNFVTLTGKLLPQMGQLIKFVNLGPDNFTLMSQEADLELAKQADSYKVVKINANGTVQMQYGDDFTLNADRATYTSDGAAHVYAEPNCRLVHADDVIEAEKVELFPGTSTAVLLEPKGVLQPQGVKFTCHKMIWENEPQLLTLQGDVSVIEDGIGTLNCEEEVEIHQKKQEGKWILSSMVAKGKTELTYELGEGIKHLLICYGKMKLDQDRSTLTLESPPNHPIEYFHDQMKLCSNHAQLNYIDKQPEKLQLDGNVQLQITEDGTRCATADQFVYLPTEEKMILSSKDGANVLFWDKEQQLSISAREVHIARADQKETIKGVGNVRFAFSNTENTLLKKLFPFYEGKAHD